MRRRFNILLALLTLWIAAALPNNGKAQIGVDSICHGTVPPMLVNTGLAAGADGQYSYEWQDSSNLATWSIATGVSNDTNYQPDSLFETTYFRRMVSAPGCGETAYSNVVRIHVFDELNSPGSVSTPATCPDRNDGALSVQMAGGFGDYHFEWETGDTTQEITGLLPGDYYYTVTDDAGCTFEGSALVSSQNLAPVMSFASDSITLWMNDQLGSPGSYDGYAWSTGSTDSSITVASTGSYSLTVSNAAGCETADTIYVQLALGTDEIAGVEVKIYPNPSRDWINIEVSDGTVPDRLQLLDHTGKLVMERASTDRLDLTDLASGMYYLKIGTDRFELTERIVLQR